jgi:repressor LexA
MPEKPKSRLSGLTAQQKRVLNYIAAFVGSEGRAPSLEEIRDHLGLSAVSTVHEHVARLVDKGHLSRRWNQPRSIEMAEGSRRWARLVPLVGRVAAGQPLEELRVPEEIAVPATLASGSGDFAVTVGDDSFAESGILADDTLVIAAATGGMHAGPLVLATVENDSIVIRRLARDDVAQSPAGGELKGRGSGAFRVLGEILGLLRKYR